jgi:hypothetical protein
MEVAAMKPHTPRDADPDILTEIPEADAAEQATAAVPDDELADALGPEPVTAPDEADPADAWEQHLTVPGVDDEDYERGARDDDHR